MTNHLLKFSPICKVINCDHIKTRVEKFDAAVGPDVTGA